MQSVSLTPNEVYLLNLAIHFMDGSNSDVEALQDKFSALNAVNVNDFQTDIHND